MSLLLGEKISLYRTLINPFYFGITSTIQNLLTNNNISNNQFGGKITKFTIDNNIINANVIYNKDSKEAIIQLINLKDKTECGVIIIHNENKTEATIQNIQGNDSCNASTLNRTNNGKIIMKLLIDMCKYYKIKKIRVADHSSKKISKYEFDLKIYNEQFKLLPRPIKFLEIKLLLSK